MPAGDRSRACSPSAWRGKIAEERGAILRRWYDLMMAESGRRLAALIALEQGKPIAEARGEIAFAAAFIDWFADEGKASTAIPSLHRTMMGESSSNSSRSNTSAWGA